MNRFQIVPGKESEFEEVWRNRESHLQNVPGILRFALLRADGDGEYISHSTWESREAFMAWMQSPAFAAGHRGSSMMGIVAGPPQVKIYDSVIAQEFAAATA
jgi:heme-degrading monooxygenase HmoA